MEAGNINNNIWQLAEAYLENTLTATELKQLEEQRRTDVAFSAEFQDCLNMLRALGESGQHTQFKNTLKDVHNTMEEQTDKKVSTKTITLLRNHWRTASIAACIAMVTSLTTFWIAQKNNNKIASQYSQLHRNLETYKRVQNQAINDIKTQAATTARPQLEARYGGTGFALTNNGYLVTSYHVVAGADSVYIQDKSGNYYKAVPVAFNETTDVMVMKVEDTRFKFSKQDIPYTIAGSKRKLGSRVYTLGFPQDEIVYNEGYISAKNGYAGDSTQYRMDITSAAGQSGSPVVDGSGNIIGIITGKETESEGTTYAVATASLLDLLQTLPAENSIKLPTANKMSRLNREQQIEKLEQFTCAIKVYKK